MTDSALQQRLEQIRARCNAATAAPWVAEISPDGTIAGVNHATLVDELGEPATVALCEIVGNNENDAMFIAASREDVPWLLERVEAVLALCDDATLVARLSKPKRYARH